MKRYISLLIFFLPLLTMGQQDPLYAQYHFNQLVINPGYTGIHNNTSVALISRLQWVGLDNAPLTNSLTASTTIVNNKVGLGLIIAQDKLGVNDNFQAHLAYSYKIEFQDKVFAFGLQTGVMDVKYNYSLLNLKYEDDPQFPPTSEQSTQPNFGTGLSLMADNYYLGISVPRILNTRFSDGTTSGALYKRHYYFSGAYLFELTSAFKLKTSAVARGVEGSVLSYDFTAMVLYNNQIWGGIYTRSLSSLGVIFQVDLKNTYRIGYAFEYPLEKDFKFTTHEVSLIADFSLFDEQEVFQRHF